MPELPEVEATCRGIAPGITGRKVNAVHLERPAIARPQHPAALARLATGRKITGVRRRGKHILIELSGGYVLHIHLRMTGRLRVDAPVSASTRLWLELSGRHTLVFDDPRALGCAHIRTAEECGAALGDLGVEPLSEEFTLEYLRQEAARSRQPAKLFLMDQSHIAGLGNIYAAEALFRARIGPVRPVNRISKQKLGALYSAIVEILREALESATITYNKPGKFEEAEGFVPAVYGREGEFCPACERTIRRIEQGGRSTYFCPHCQR